jgi:type IV pilus assembly protein PilC
MRTYYYKARDERGKLIKGTMQAASQAELAARLQQIGYILINIRETPALNANLRIHFKFTRIKPQDVIIFNIQLANMINAGIALSPSLRILTQQLENKKLKEVVRDVHRRIESGISFSDALQAHPRIFSRLFVSMVRVGEASGKIDSILKRLSQFLQYQADIKQKIKGAFLYPIILVVAAIALLLFISTAVVPAFVEVFNRSGVNLPTITLLLYGLGISIKHFGLALLLFLCLVFYLLKKFYLDTENGRWRIDSIKLKLPLFAGMLRKVYISRFTQTLATLIGAGVPILTSLEILKDTIGNAVLANTIGDVHTAVSRGCSISESLATSREIPPDVVAMIATAEESGALEEMLDKISHIYETSLDYNIKTFTTWLEPALIILMGCVVGFIMISLLLPMFDLIKVIR